MKGLNSSKRKDKYVQQSIYISFYVLFIGSPTIHHFMLSSDTIYIDEYFIIKPYYTHLFLFICYYVLGKYNTYIKSVGMLQRSGYMLPPASLVKGIIPSQKLLHHVFLNDEMIALTLSEDEHNHPVGRRSRFHPW